MPAGRRAISTSGIKLILCGIHQYIQYMSSEKFSCGTEARRRIYTCSDVVLMVVFVCLLCLLSLLLCCCCCCRCCGGGGCCCFLFFFCAAGEKHTLPLRARVKEVKQKAKDDGHVDSSALWSYSCLSSPRFKLTPSATRDSRLRRSRNSNPSSCRAQVLYLSRPLPPTPATHTQEGGAGGGGGFEITFCGIV